jgi:hypothetical protein
MLCSPLHFWRVKKQHLQIWKISCKEEENLFSAVLKNPWQKPFCTLYWVCLLVNRNIKQRFSAQGLERKMEYTLCRKVSQLVKM